MINEWYFYLLILENRSWHFTHTTFEDDLYEMSSIFSSKKIGLNISSKMSPEDAKEMIQMQYQCLFVWKKKKTLNYYHNK